MNRLIILTVVLARILTAQEVSFQAIPSKDSEAGVDSLVDLLPLAPGNQWTYDYYYIFRDDSQGAVAIEGADSGTVTEQIVSKSITADSAIWTVRETRILSLQYNNGLYSSPRTTVDTFILVESLQDQHRIHRLDNVNQSTRSAFPFSLVLPDTALIYRYGVVDSSNKKIVSTRQWPGFYRLTFTKLIGVQSFHAYDGCTCLVTYSIFATLRNSNIVGITGHQSEPISTEFFLFQNYPNPFNPSTIISFSVPTRSFVTLKLFDLIGREVATIVSEELHPGQYYRQWTASGLTSGLYIYRLQAGSRTENKKLIFLK